MYHIYLSFYKHSKSTFASFIRAQQRLQWIPYPFANYSHEEIVFGYVDDPEVFSLIKKIKEIYADDIISFWFKNLNTGIRDRKNYFKQRWLWFSSSESDGGCRFKFIEDNKNNWDFFKVEVTREQYLSALRYSMGFDDYSYGWTKIIFTQALKTLWFIKAKTFFCSEISTIISQRDFNMFEWINSIEINPWKAAWLLDKNHQTKWEWVKHIS